MINQTQFSNNLVYLSQNRKDLTIRILKHSKILESIGTYFQKSNTKNKGNNCFYS